MRRNAGGIVRDSQSASKGGTRWRCSAMHRHCSSVTFGKRRHDRLFLREAQRLHQEVVGQADRTPVPRLKLENQGTRRMFPRRLDDAGEPGNGQFLGLAHGDQPSASGPLRQSFRQQQASSPQRSRRDVPKHTGLASPRCIARISSALRRPRQRTPAVAARCLISSSFMIGSSFCENPPLYPGCDERARPSEATAPLSPVGIPALEALGVRCPWAHSRLMAPIIGSNGSD